MCTVRIQDFLSAFFFTFSSHFSKKERQFVGNGAGEDGKLPNSHRSCFIHSFNIHLGLTTRSVFSYFSASVVNAVNECIYGPYRMLKEWRGKQGELEAGLEE